MNPVILFDGVCGLCNRFVRFVLKRDSKDLFRFASLQSGYAHEILRRHGRNATVMDTVVLVLDPESPREMILEKSRAAFKVLKELGGLWRCMAWCAVLPHFITDFGYDIVARTRYKIFGKYDSCPLPQEHERKKFIEI